MSVIVAGLKLSGVSCLTNRSAGRSLSAPLEPDVTASAGRISESPIGKRRLIFGGEKHISPQLSLLCQLHHHPPLTSSVMAQHTIEENMDQRLTISAEAIECKELFRDALAVFQYEDRAMEMQDEFGRFNLWASNIAVFVPGQGSLDFRLIDMPEVKDQFLRQLGLLKWRLKQCW